MRNSFRFIGLAAVAALSLTAWAFQDPAILKRVAKVGDVGKYRLKADIDVKGSAVSFSGLVTEKVVKVAEDGQYTVESSTTESKVSYAGTEMPSDGQGPATGVTIFKSNGEVVSIAAEQSDPNLLRMANLLSIRFAATPVKVGDSWELTIPKSDQGAVEAKDSYKLEAQEKVGERDTYRIHRTLKENLEKDAASVDAMYWVDVKDGSLVKLTGTWVNAPFPAPIGPITTKISMTRE